MLMEGFRTLEQRYINSDKLSSSLSIITLKTLIVGANLLNFLINLPLCVKRPLYMFKQVDMLWKDFNKFLLS
jgi:hypothetical protein